MSRKDYELIAKAIASATPWRKMRDLPEHTWLDCVEHLADALTTDPQFDRAKFLTACDYFKMLERSPK